MGASVTQMQYPAVELRTSPHLKSAVTTAVIMRNVVYALMPVCAFSVFAFGLSALAVIATSTIFCVLTEWAVCKFQGRESTLGDWSAVITGLLLGLTLPPAMPLWMVALGGVVSIGLGKMLFGGLGFNVFNPALVGRAFLQAAFPTAITTWVPAMTGGRFANFVPTTLTFPFARPDWAAVKAFAANVDGWTGATPLALMKFDMGTPAYEAISNRMLFLGDISGSAGETCAFIILLGGVYLAARGMLSWRIPAAVLASAFVLSGIFWLVDKSAFPSPVFMLFSGGLMLGAVFMATDMVTSPVTPLGMWIFGGIIGGLTVIIRLFGGLPEGVMYSILLANALTPLINQFTQPRIYGARKAETQ